VAITLRSLYEVTESSRIAEETAHIFLFSIIAIKEITGFDCKPFGWVQRILTSFLDSFWAGRAENQFRVFIFCIY
jgi:hypothetical protein